jgi:transcriptional regulator of arginine metabolism
MHSKVERHKAILDLVGSKAVATQAELKELLKARGIEADQATLSRDVKELSLVKVGAPDGGYRYATVDEVVPPPRARAPVVVSRLVRAADSSGNLVVVKTDPGEASPVALAIDRLAWPEVLGTVAGDDTLFIVVREGASARRLARKILGVAGKKHAA